MISQRLCNSKKLHSLETLISHQVSVISTQQMILSSLLNKPNLHRKSQSTLPTLSLNELQKNYYLLRQRKENKILHHKSSTKSVSNLESQILVKSPFYDRNKCSNKHSCKCEYHKKIHFKVEKKHKQKDHFQLTNSLQRLKTLANENLPKSILSHKRFNSSADDTEFTRVKDNKYYQNLITNNHQLYQQFLKKLHLQKKSNLDCFDHQFQQFLKSHGKWILHDINKLTFGKGSSSISNGQNNRFQTVPSLPRNSSTESYTVEQSKDKYIRMNAEEMRKDIRRKHTQNTQLSFQSENQQKLLKTRPFLNCLQNLKTQDRNKLQLFFQGACREIGLNYSQLKTQTLDNANFFTTICKNLLDSDGKIVQKAQSVLKRLSRLPFDLYSVIMKQMNLELTTNFDPKTKIFQPNSEKMEHSVCLAFETIQESLGSMMKNKDEARGKQKLSILGKLKYKFVGRSSLNYYAKSDSKNKLRFSNSDSTKQKQDSNRSRFDTDKKNNRYSQNQNSFNSQSESEQYNSDSNQNTTQNMLKQKLVDQGSKQQRKSIKKGLNLHKNNKNNIMRIIDEQIQFQNSKKPISLKKINSLVEDEYLRERKLSRKRQRDQELNRHLQFLRIMKEKQNVRASSTMIECEMKKNNARAHYQRHKIFLKRMEVLLQSNDTLKQMIINYEDDLFTKKRKVRILKNMIHHEIPNQQSEFCKDMNKYIDIFEKNCQLVIGRNNWGRFKKYTKRKGYQLFENSYLEKEGLQTPAEMGDLIQMLKNDHNLKFYNVVNINFEDEEYFSLIKQIPTFTSEKVKSSVSKKQQLLIQNVLDCVQNNGLNDVLAQRGMESKINPIKTTNLQDEDSQREEHRKEVIQSESKDLKSIRERFKRNMEKYQRIFKTEMVLRR